MAAHWQEWLSLLVRWAHFITGVAWIGASFYFNWLENHLERRLFESESGDDPIDGDLWAIHGGGFYYWRLGFYGHARLIRIYRRISNFSGRLARRRIVSK